MKDIRDKVRKLLGVLSLLSPELEEEFWDRVKEVVHEVDRKEMVIGLHFTLDLEKGKLSGELLRAFANFINKSSDAKFVRFYFDGYKWEEDEVLGIVAACAEHSPQKVSIKGNKVVVYTEDVAAVNRYIHLIGTVLNVLFGKERSIDVSARQEELGNSVREGGKGGISGEYCCFKLEKRVDHGGNKKYKAGFSNLESFYWLSISSRGKGEESADDLFNRLRVNGWYRIRFSLNSNGRFADSLDGFLNEAEEIEDKEDGLGIVLHRDITDFGGVACAVCTHTKNSAFDGLYSVKELVEEAAGRGHGAIGLTDAGSVQSYAEFESAVKKAGIKGLYGVEMEVIPLKTPVLVGGFGDKWEDVGMRIGEEVCEGWNGVSFCVLDIETTGLYPFKDEIIQVAAKRYTFEKKNLERVAFSFNESKKRGGKHMNVEDLRGIVLEGEFDRYVKIGGRLSEHIVKLTNITQEKLDEDGEEIGKVLGEFKEFVKGSVLVAHNGIEFDIPFINAHLRKCGLGELEETTLDTLPLSRYLFAEKRFKSHSLQALAKKAAIPYDEEVAHNAVYDVDILVNLFFGFLLPELNEKEKIDVGGLRGLNGYFWERQNRTVWGDNVLIYIRNQKGVRDMYELVSLAHTDYYFDGVKLWRGALEERRKNLLVVSNPFPSERGVLGAVLKDDRGLFNNLVKWFDYVTIPPVSHLRHIRAKDDLEEGDMEEVVRTMVRWCEEEKVKWFFSGAVRYIDKTRDWERYAVLVNTKGIAGRRHYLANEKELPDLDFKYTGDLMEEYRGLWEEKEWKKFVKKSLKVNGEFVEKIEGDIEVIKKKLYPPRIEKCGELLKGECDRRLKEKYGECRNEVLLGRYETEMKSIIDNDFSVIYWFSHVLVKESIREGYLVGSRGSVGSSLVAYLAGISEVNPLPPHYYCGKCGAFEVVEGFKESGFDLEDRVCGGCGEMMGRDGHDIPFETFLGFEGNKVPDIDLNFSGEYQLRAHNFLQKYFGEKKVFRAGTIGTMAEKTAIAVVERYKEEKGSGRWNKGRKMWLMDKLVDVKRTTGQHPGGILVVPDDMSIYDFSPINYPANDTSSTWYTTHFAFEDLHDSLLKFDILGHDDPTTLKLLKELTGFDPLDVPVKDEKLIGLYSSCEVMDIRKGELLEGENTGALGLPEFGTALTRKIIQACDPKTFADLIRISGFSHGTGVWKRNIDALVKGGKSLNSVITCRDDIMLYLMREGLSREDAFNITESIRKGRGLSEEYQGKMKEVGIPDWYIDSAKKISYIFPKAHATAYVLMSWRIAYYKLYHPLAFYSSYFSTSLHSFDMEVLAKNDRKYLRQQYEKLSKDTKNPGIKSSAVDKSKLVVYEVAYEFLTRGFRFENVCVNRSESGLFVPDEETKTLRIPLVAVSGCGEQLAKSIIAGRKDGFYRSMKELHERGGVNNKLIEKMKELEILPDGFAMGDEIFDEEGSLIKSRD